MQQGLAACRATGARFVLYRWLGLLAELQGRAGQREAGRRLLEEACAIVRQDGPSSFVAQLYRIHGDFLLQTGARYQEAQVGVFMGYVSRHDHTLLDFRLSLPEDWARDEHRTIWSYP